MFSVSEMESRPQTYEYVCVFIYVDRYTLGFSIKQCHLSEPCLQEEVSL